MADRSTVGLLALLTVGTVTSQALLKHATSTLRLPDTWTAVPGFAIACASSWAILLSLALQIAGYVGWGYALSRGKLATSVATSGALFYLLSALVGWAMFDERLSATEAAGLGLIVVGLFVMLR